MTIKKIFFIFVLIVFVSVLAFLGGNVINKSKQHNSTMTRPTTTVAVSTVTTAASQNQAEPNSVNLTTTTSTVADTDNEQSAQTSPKKLNVKTVKITDNFFIEQINDVLMNMEDYLNQTIIIEGLMYSYTDEDGVEIHAVVRNTPGCCGNDGLAGLYISYDQTYPADDTWVEVIGTIRHSSYYNNNLPEIKVKSITPKPTGKTFVTN